MTKTEQLNMTKTEQLNVSAFIIKQAYANYQTMGQQPTYQPDDGYGMQAKILRGLSNARGGIENAAGWLGGQVPPAAAAISSAFKAPPPGYAYGQGPATASAQYLASQPKAAPAPAAVAPQQDLTAQFKKFHGTAYDPNSSRDKKLYAQMQQLQTAGTPLTSKSVYGQQYGKQANAFTDAAKNLMKSLTSGKGAKGFGTNVMEGAKGIGEGVANIGSKLYSAGSGQKGWSPRDLQLTEKARMLGRDAGHAIGAGTAIAAPPALAINSLMSGRRADTHRQEGRQEATQKFMEMLNKNRQSKMDSGYFQRLLDAVTNRGY